MCDYCTGHENSPMGLPLPAKMCLVLKKYHRKNKKNCKNSLNSKENSTYFEKNIR